MTIKTNAHAYNYALREQKKHEATVTLDEIKTFCNGNPEKDKNLEPLPHDAHCPQLDLSGFYLAQIASDAMKQMGIEDNDRNRKTLEHIAYNTNCYNRAVATIKKYQDMIANGYTPIHDITPDMHGRKAHMVGESSGIMGTTKIDEKITIVHDGKYQGYRKPRQRTRYYVPAMDSQSFIKLI